MLVVVAVRRGGVGARGQVQRCAWMHAVNTEVLRFHIIFWIRILLMAYNPILDPEPGVKSYHLYRYDIHAESEFSDNINMSGSCRVPEERVLLTMSYSANTGFCLDILADLQGFQRVQRTQSPVALAINGC